MQKPEESELSNFHKFLALAVVVVVGAVIAGIYLLITPNSNQPNLQCDSSMPAPQCSDPLGEVEDEAEKTLNKYPDATEYDQQGDCGGQDCKQVEKDIQQEIQQ